MATPTSAPTEPSPLEKAACENAGGLLDARRNLITVGREAETAIGIKRDAILKELAKGTTPDQLVALAKTAAATLEGLDKDEASIHTLRLRIDESLKDIASTACLVSVYAERHDRIKTELDRSADNNKPLEEELKRLNDEIKALNAKKKTATTP